MNKATTVKASSQQKIFTIAQKLLQWFSANARDLPWRRTRDPYAVWISEIMLQQTQVKTVIPYWERWMRELPSIKALAQAKPEKVLKLWEGLGYYTRARNLQRAAQMLCEKHGGNFPQQFDDVLALPGIGRYTAGAICSIAYNQPTPILDGNTIRVLCRIFGIDGNARDKDTQSTLWNIAEVLVVEASKMPVTPGGLPQIQNAGNCSRLNQSLMELGAMICTPRGPVCKTCPVTKLCVARKTKRVQDLPKLGKPIPSTARRIVAFVIEKRGHFLICQRPAGVVNAHLWEFPNVEVSPKEKFAQAAQFLLPIRWGEGKDEGSGLTVLNSKPFCTIRHTITRYRITLDIYQAQLKNPGTKQGRWANLAELKQLPFTGAHRKIVKLLETRSRQKSF
jgi:A/G-specific adenine glycosylase